MTFWQRYSRGIIWVSIVIAAFALAFWLSGCATRYEPPDGETSPEECPKCGHPFGEEDKWEESEPPEPDHHDDREDWL